MIVTKSAFGDVLKHGGDICTCSPITELLETVSRLLTNCSRFYPHADLNMAENLIVRLQVAVDSVRRLIESLDRDDQANADRIPQLESLVRQLQLLNRWEILAIRASSFNHFEIIVLVNLAFCVGM